VSATRWLVIVMLIGCGSSKPAPSRDECLRAVAYERWMEDLAAVSDELAQSPKLTTPPESVQEAREVLEASDRDSAARNEPRDSMPLVDACTALSRAHLECVFAAKSVEAIRSCPEHPTMPALKPSKKR
jgi:hypothetical protein